ncbi:MAG: hypothetical protein ABIH87_01310 [bacterium]
MLSGWFKFGKSIQRKGKRLNIGRKGVGGSVQVAPQVRVGASMTKGVYVSVLGRVITLKKILSLVSAN